MNRTGARNRLRGFFLGILAALVLMLSLGIWLLDVLDGSDDFCMTTPFFSGKRVMVLVPHQDDEINLVGGVMEQYVRAGSEVILVFATNGDYNGLAEERSREVLAAAQAAGIPAGQVYYLGYGNQWEYQQQEGTERRHIYFSADGDALWTSHYGATGTYGTSVIDCYRDSAYTRNNFLKDLTDLILQLRPDVIYCSDYDAHHDHMALDLFFEEAMADILTREQDYHPAVYKGLCYGTGWYAEADFVGAENLVSSLHPTWENWERLGIGYSWEDRVRLPISTGNLNRLLSRTEIHQSLRLYQSQDGHQFSEHVLNGDKVFWERRTDSLLYRADFFGDGEQVFVWNDFKLKDSTEFSALVNTGLAYARSIAVIPEEPVTMDALWLYDNPSPEDNILAGCVLFDDGSRVDFGPLEPGGAATKICFEQRTVSSFEIILSDVQGEAPGLAEIEAYCGPWINEDQPQLLMAVDAQDNFVYDYWVTEQTTALRLYAYPGGWMDWGETELSVEADPDCTWTVSDGRLLLTCPRGRSMTITVSAAEAESTFTVSNPGPFLRQLTRLLQTLDRKYAIG